MEGIVRQIQSSGIEADQRKKLIDQVVQTYSDVDTGYLNALYFPESSPAARIPSRFGVPSSTFTHRYNYYMNTGTGSGIIGIAPQDTTFLSSFEVRSNSSVLGQDIFSNAPYFRGESDCRFIASKFSEARLVGCSIRVSYIGTAQDESGFMVGSHIFDATPWTLNEDVIENGYFVTRGKPHDGIRLVYIPKDEHDLTYAPQTFQVTTPSTFHAIFPTDATGSFQVPAHAFLAHTSSTYNDINVGAGVNDGQDIVVTMKTIASDAASLSNQGMPIQWNSTQLTMPPSFYYGQHNNKGKSQSPNIMAVYFRGMPANKDWIRVDVERHFEALPRQDLKDFVGVARPMANEKTMDFVQNMSMNTQLHGHNLETADHYERNLKPVMHLVPDHPKLVTEKTDNSNWFTSLARIAGSGVGYLLGGAGGMASGSQIAGGLADSWFGTSEKKYSQPALNNGNSAYNDNPSSMNSGYGTQMKAITYY